MTDDRILIERTANRLRKARQDKGLTQVEVAKKAGISENHYAQIEEMAVEGILTGNKRLIYQAVAYSPLTAAVLSLAEIQQMVDELFAVNEQYLVPQAVS